jgi:voltage-gated potassium channel
MSAPIKGAAIGILLLFIWTVIGTIGFMTIEGWSFLDSTYMTVITISTVGFSEVNGLSDVGKGFAMFLIIGGWITSVNALARISQLLFEGGFFDIRGEKKRWKKIMELENHYIVCGHGRMGNGIIEGLIAENKAFVVIDSDGNKAERFKSQHINYIIGDATSEATLKKAGISRAKSLLAMLPTDADNLYLAIAAKELNPNIYLIAQALYEVAEKRLRKSGADLVISPYKLASKHALHAAVSLSPEMNLELGHSSIGVPVSLREVTIDKSSILIGKSIQTSQLKADYGILVVGIKKRSGEVLINPEPKDFIHEGDVLVIAGTNADLTRVQSICS